MKSVGVRISVFLFLCFAGISLAQTPYDVTKKGYTPEVKLVHDFGNMLNAVERSQLENKLVAYDDSTSVQIVIVTFKNLEGYPIELLGNEIGEKWGVGQKDTHNGIVIVLSDEDRKVTLRGAYGIQAKMPPTVEKLIIDQEMIPQFRNGNYYQGLDNAINAIQQQLAGQYQAKPKSSSSGDGGGILVFLFFLFVIVIFIIIASKGGGGGGGNRSKRGFNWGDVIFTSGGTRSWGGGSSWGGGGSFGGSGGGFGGFGGGSFGGGGASGSW